MKTITFIVLLFISMIARGQSVSINTDGSTANASAMLDIKSTSRGLLIPRMTKTQRTAIASPAKGLLVFVDDVDSVGFHFYNGSNWLWIEALGTAGWKTRGNAGTDTAVNFIGTTDIMPIRFKQNNQWLGQWNGNNGTYYLGKGAGEASAYPGTIAIGDSALSKNSLLAGYNLAIGNLAMKDNINGSYSTAIGYKALSKTNSGVSYNTAMGSFALSNNVNGVASTAVGTMTLANDTSVGYNTALGYASMQSNTFGYANTALGTNSMLFNKTGTFNVAVGNNAMISSDKADQNVAIGDDALRNDTVGFNTAVGSLALYSNTSGTRGVGLGNAALYFNTSGFGNTALGFESLFHNTTGDNNLAVGFESLFNNTSGNYNLAVGDSAGFKNTTASSNIFIGHVAGFNNQTRTNLLFIGDSTGYANTAGSEQVFIGNYAGKNHKTNSRNTFVGVYAGYADSIGFNNTFIGEEAGYNNKGTAANTGIRNTFLGQSAGYTNTSGNENTLLGYNADVLSIGLNNAAAIGANAAVNQNNSLVLGSISGVNGAAANTYVGIGTTAPQYKLHVVNDDPQSGGWLQGIMVENISSPIGNVGEAAVSFRNIAVPTGYQWNIGMNQNPNFAINYGNDFNAGNTRMVIDTFGNVGIGIINPTAVLDVDGTYKLGTNGTKNAALIKDTVNINVGSVPANGELDVTIALANVTTNGAVSVSPAADISSGIVIAWARVSAAGIIKIRYRNLTGGAIDPPAIDYYISVVQ